MAQINLMFPILPGQKEAHQALLAQVLGEKRADFDARCHRLGINWERGFYLDGPAGTLFLLVMDLADPASLFATMMAAPSEFEQWFMGQVAPIHGLDPAKAKDIPAPELMFEYAAAGKTPGKPDSAIAVPVLDVDGWRGMMAVLKGEKDADFAAERARLGITRETHWLHQTPMGAFSAISFEGDLSDLGAKMAAPANEFGTWFMAQIGKFNGFTPEMAAHMAMPTPCYDFQASVPAAAR